MKRRNQLATFCLSIAMVSGSVFGGAVSAAAQETETETEEDT